MNHKPLYIFDIDGTIALTDHRNHILENTDDKNRWDKFYSLCDKDEPNLPVIQVMESLSVFSDIWFFTGRRSDVRDKTEKWICDNTNLTMDYLHGRIMMRGINYYTPDNILKEQWYNTMLDSDKERLVAVFEDRKRVVNMWRKKGVPCFQVANGEF